MKVYRPLVTYNNNFTITAAAPVVLTLDAPRPTSYSTLCIDALVGASTNGTTVARNIYVLYRPDGATNQTFYRKTAGTVAAAVTEWDLHGAGEEPWIRLPRPVTSVTSPQLGFQSSVATNDVTTMTIMYHWEP